MFGLGCEADFDLRQGVTLTCEGDSDCPDGSSCTLNYDGSLSVCVRPVGRIAATEYLRVMNSVITVMRIRPITVSLDVVTPPAMVTPSLW